MESIPEKTLDAGCQNTYRKDNIRPRLAFSGEPKKKTMKQEIIQMTFEALLRAGAQVNGGITSTTNILTY